MSDRLDATPRARGLPPTPAEWPKDEQIARALARQHPIMLRAMDELRRKAPLAGRRVRGLFVKEART